MKLYIKQRVWTLNEQFDVRNELDEVVFYVEGSFFKFPKSFRIFNALSQEVCVVEDLPFRFLPQYVISTSKQTITLRNEFSFFFRRFTLIGTDWMLEGDFWSHDYHIISGNHPVMSIRKEWFTWGDSYELEILDPNDAVLCLAIVISVDNVLQRRNS